MPNPFRIISEELPKFLSDMNVPFSKSREQSVMREDNGNEEKNVLENLITGALGIVPIAKGVQVAAKVKGAIPVAIAAGTQDPTALLPGGAGLLAQSNDAEATIVPAHLLKSQSAIDAAMSVLKQGHLPKHVYNTTGIYEGPLDKIPRAVISDKGARIKNIRGETLGDFLQHDELFKVLPELKNTRVADVTDEYRGQLRGGHVYDPKTNESVIFIDKQQTPEQIISTILHENQHSIQSKHGMITGGNPRLEKKTDRFIKKAQPALEAEANYPDLTDEVIDDVITSITRQLYEKGGGEAEARAVQAMLLEGRAGGRYTGFPLDRYDVDPSKVIRPARPDNPDKF